MSASKHSSTSEPAVADASAAPDGDPREAHGGDRPQLLVEVWKKTIDTQLELTQLAAKSRQLGVVVMVAALVVAVVVAGRGGDWAIRFAIGGGAVTLHAAVLILLASVAALLLLRTLDLQLHDRMLRGVQSFGEDLEEQHLRPVVIGGVSKGLSQAIAHFSRYEDAAISKDGRRQVYIGTVEHTARDRVKHFYTLAAAAPAVVAVLALAATNLSSKRAEAGPSAPVVAGDEAVPVPAAAPTPAPSMIPERDVAPTARAVAPGRPGVARAAPAAKGAEPTAKGAEPAAKGAEPAATGAAPAAKAAEPTAKAAEPTAKPAEPAAKAAEPAAKAAEPAAKQADPAPPPSAADPAAPPGT